MNINLNGKTIESQSSTLKDLVRENGLNPRALVAEVNLEVIRQEDWETFQIKDGDSIELLNFVGGG